jgi:hypothetical protein
MDATGRICSPVFYSVIKEKSWLRHLVPQVCFSWCKSNVFYFRTSPIFSDQYCYSRLAVNFEYSSTYTTAICEPAVCENTDYSGASASERSERRQKVLAEARYHAGTSGAYVWIPSGMRVSPDVARTGWTLASTSVRSCVRSVFLIPIDCRYVNGNLYLMKRQLGCCIPVPGGLWVSASIILHFAYSRKHESQTLNPLLHSLLFICIQIVYMSLIVLQQLGSGRRRILGTADSRSGWCVIRRKSIHKRAIHEAEKY